MSATTDIFNVNLISNAIKLTTVFTRGDFYLFPICGCAPFCLPVVFICMFSFLISFAIDLSILLAFRNSRLIFLNISFCFVFYLVFWFFF